MKNSELSMHSQVIRDKAKLRSLAKERRKSLPTLEEDQRINKHLQDFLLAAPPHATIISYISIQEEFPTRTLLTHLAAARSDLLLYAPRVESSLQAGARMEAYPLPIRDGKILWEDLEHRKTGLVEPRRSIPFPTNLASDEPQTRSEPTAYYETFLIVPALLIDQEGYRLGYGGGYYDRYIERLGDSALLLAPQRRFMLAQDLLPRGPHDHPIDLVVNQSGLKRTNPLSRKLYPNQERLLRGSGI